MVCLGAAIPFHLNCPTVICLCFGPFAPFATVERPATGFWPQPTPLLEKEGHLCSFTLIAHFTRPFDQHRPCARPAFTTDDHPMNAFQINFAYRPEKRLDR